MILVSQLAGISHPLTCWSPCSPLEGGNISSVHKEGMKEPSEVKLAGMTPGRHRRHCRAETTQSQNKCSSASRWCMGDTESRAVMVWQRRLLQLQRVSPHLHPSQTLAGQKASNASRPSKQEYRKRAHKRVNNSRNCPFEV